jgi:mono/diheme cytochrome c family protein
MWRTPSLSIAIAGVMTLAGWAARADSRVDAGSAPAAAQTRPARADHQSGAYLFRAFCASCHGQSGRGDGPVADLLRQRPPDLTQISRRAGGVFPRDAVIRTVDGRRPLRPHGSDMPVWGDVLKTTEGQDERVISQRIDALASHIESLQVK